MLAKRSHRKRRPTTSRSDGFVDIYLLADPRDGAIRYVGQSVDARKRFKNHVEQVGIPNPAMCKWLDELRKLRLTPQLNIIARVSPNSVGVAERLCIYVMRGLGAQLLNVQHNGKTK